MKVSVNTVKGATIVALEGDIDGSTAPVAQSQILEQIVPGQGLIVDMTQVAYMSSAGLRMLLSAHRVGGSEARVGAPGWSIGGPAGYHGCHRVPGLLQYARQCS